MEPSAASSWRRRLADRFSYEAARCSSMKELRELMANAAAELGFGYFALLHHSSLARPDRQYIRIDNYPEEWVTELVGTKLYMHDPVHLASRRTTAGFLWRDLGRFTNLGRQQKKILERSRYFGLGEGLTVPINVPGEPSGSCSFAMAAGFELPEQHFLSAELIGLHAFEAARRLSPAPPTPSRPHLSRREVQCLRLLAAGKTDWEIGAILGISVETARQYVKRARRAYDVVTRTQLVVLGLRDEWLDFNDAEDPSL